MLFLGNQFAENPISFTYTSSEDDFLLCQNMPSSIPIPLDSLHNVRLQGNCLNPLLLNRFDRCLIGTVAYGDHFDDLKLFSINSAGDLFVQQLNNNRPLDVSMFKKAVSIKSQKISKLTFTKICDLSKLWKMKPPKIHKENDKRSSIWRVSKENMTSYVDHLAPIILSPWDIDDLSEWEHEGDNVDNINDDFNSNYTDKINYWFNKNNSILGLSKPSKQTSDNQPINFLSRDAAKSLKSDSDEDSSSGKSLC